MRVRVVAVAAVVAVTFLVGGVILATVRAPGPDGAGSAPSSAGPSALTSGSIAAGTYQVRLTAGVLTMTIPPGWSSPGPSATHLALHRDFGPTDDIVEISTDMRRPMKDATCTEAPDPSVAPTVDALIFDLASDQNLRILDATPVRVAGAAGQVIDLILAPRATRTCPFSGGQPTVPLVVGASDAPGRSWSLGPREEVGLVVLQAARGHNLVVAIRSAGGDSYEDLADAAAPIIRSFVFEPTTAKAFAAPPIASPAASAAVG